MRIEDCNWMQVEQYLERDDRIVVPLGSVEQHAYLSLGVDRILSQRVSEEAAEPLGVLVMPSLPYGLTPYFAAYPGSPTLRVETYGALLTDLLDSLAYQGFRRFLFVNGHGGNDPGRAAVEAWDAAHSGCSTLLAQLVGGHAGPRRRRRYRRRRVACLVVRELPVDAARRRRTPRREKADGRHHAHARARAGGSARAARRRLARRRLRTARRRRAARLGRPGSTRCASCSSTASMTDLSGRIALVTGTAHGIGSGIAAALEAHGATVHGVDRDTVDVSDAHQVGELVERIGRVDILVNNAGGVVGQVGRPLEQVSDDDWQAVVDANLTSTFVCTRAVAPGMKAATLRADRQHLLGRRAQRQPHRYPGLRERQGGPDRLHPPDGARARAVRDHGQRDRARLRALEPDLDRAVRELRRGGSAPAGRVDRNAAARDARGHRERRPLLRRRGVVVGDGTGDLDRWWPLDLLRVSLARPGGLRRDPERQHATPTRRPDMRRAAEWVAARARRSRTAASSRRTGTRSCSPSGSDVAGRADDPRLRPLRRAAAGRRRRMDDAAVRADACATAASTRAARPTTRARSWCALETARRSTSAAGSCR